jgi:hypothetical protein
VIVRLFTKILIQRRLMTWLITKIISVEYIPRSEGKRYPDTWRSCRIIMPCHGNIS